MKRDLYIISQVIRTGKTVVTKVYSVTYRRDNIYTMFDNPALK